MEHQTSKDRGDGTCGVSAVLRRPHPSLALADKCSRGRSSESGCQPGPPGSWEKVTGTRSNNQEWPFHRLLPPWVVPSLVKEPSLNFQASQQVPLFWNEAQDVYLLTLHFPALCHHFYSLLTTWLVKEGHGHRAPQWIQESTRKSPAGTWGCIQRGSGGHFKILTAHSREKATAQLTGKQQTQWLLLTQQGKIIILLKMQRPFPWIFSR